MAVVWWFVVICAHICKHRAHRLDLKDKFCDDAIHKHHYDPRSAF